MAVDLSKQHPAPHARMPSRAPHATQHTQKEAARALMHQHQTRIAEATWPMKRETCSLELAEHWVPPPPTPSPTLRASSSRMERQPPCESKPARHTPELMTSALARVWARRGAQLQSRACGAAPRGPWLTHLPHPARPFLHLFPLLTFGPAPWQWWVIGRILLRSAVVHPDAARCGSARHCSPLLDVPSVTARR